MSQELERVYTINLGKVLLSQSQHRAVRAINMIKEFARHHMKVEDIKIEEDLAHQIWAKGIRSPPRKIRVRMSKTDEGYVLVSTYEEDVESKVTPEKETPKVDDKVEEPAKEAPKKEEPAKEAPKK
ncbi:50S ribosomal protein L31e, partial [Nitrosopumilus sp. b2]|uniref:50S ribosomal protein L31e n=1 Tax=Nitrosopumilus sp. b2 TaxID=2109908 RepID=UPI001CEBE916